MIFACGKYCLRKYRYTKLASLRDLKHRLKAKCIGLYQARSRSHYDNNELVVGYALSHIVPEGQRMRLTFWTQLVTPMLTQLQLLVATAIDVLDDENSYALIILSVFLEFSRL